MHRILLKRKSAFTTDEKINSLCSFVILEILVTVKFLFFKKSGILMLLGESKRLESLKCTVYVVSEICHLLMTNLSL